MSTTATPSRSLEESYQRAREKGHDHREAAQRAEHAFGGGRRPHQLAAPIARARDAWDAEHAEKEPLRVGDPVDEEQPEPDAFSDAEGKIRERIRELQGQRQVVSLDSLTDSKARAQIAAIEKQLAESEAELSRVLLARTEAASREHAAREAEEQQAITDALKLVDDLGVERAKAAKAADRAAQQLGSALVQLHDVEARQGEALVRAGRLDVAHANLTSDGDIAGAVAHALATTGAPSGWANLNVLPRFIAPLA